MLKIFQSQRLASEVVSLVLRICGNHCLWQKSRSLEVCSESLLLWLKQHLWYVWWVEASCAVVSGIPISRDVSSIVRVGIFVNFVQSVGNIHLLSLPGLDPSKCSGAVCPKVFWTFGCCHLALTESSQLCSKCCRFKFLFWNAQLLDQRHFCFSDHISGCGISIGFGCPHINYGSNCTHWSVIERVKLMGFIGAGNQASKNFDWSHAVELIHPFL